MFNKVVLVGNLTRDIELRYAQSGSAIGSTGIAVTRKFNGANGEKREETCFIDITFFGRQAEIANQYLNKGSKVLIEGRLKLDQWQDQQGNPRSKHSITVENMEMLGGGQGGYNQTNNTQNTNSYQETSYRQNSNMTASRQNFNNDSKAPMQTTKEQNGEYYEEKIPVINVDDEKYDNDETIPF